MVRMEWERGKGELGSEKGKDSVRKGRGTRERENL